MFPNSFYINEAQNSTNNTVYPDTPSVEDTFAPMQGQDDYPYSAIDQQTSMQETTVNPSEQMSVDNTAKSDILSEKSAFDHEIANLMAQVNDSLERELKQTKKAMKCIFKEIVAFHEVAKSVHEMWAPIHEAEYNESIRLDELQAEVQRTIGAFTTPMEHSTNNIDLS
jgi:hypothetical protein